ncbi:DUF4395 domain-containing protein [Microbacterium sp. LRZ72]|uniref:DUF4395 domain-containing protein n=1 Tax=Microbacterium sp. LRZ72 TaxID=2942481 RepID=UPI0029B06C10|nr:DUF4395 domain-containing protein [Microbacterium sp. LRZ72]MDX2377438.1 DUF4395 domain-containing protein [Microbacterium sp. LRZ72]
MSDRPSPAGIDPRGPRFAAAITSLLLLIAVLLGLVGQPIAATAVARATDAAFVLLGVIALLFLWGVLSPRTAPWAALYRTLIRPRLAPPTEQEDPRPPRFAQGVGLSVTTAGLVLHLAGVPWAVPIAAAVAFVAAFLNAAFGFCLGCQMYLLLQRAGVLGRSRAA